ncbi:MAG: hypothetical protein NTX65_08960 [Ignavibacteriales bacterium]|nr:hypothetical protein [Ignavibacteriales bacterium]
MIKKLFLIIFFLLGISLIHSQEVTFDKVQQEYENFEYDKVINLSDQLIAKGNISDSLLIELHMMRAIVFYSTGADSSTRKSFESILKIKRNYLPDPLTTSPKLITIFNEVKAEFIRKNPDLDVIQPADSTRREQEVKYLAPVPAVSAVVKNLLLPGLGQLHHGNLTKGWLNTVASTLNIGAVIYFTIDANKKQDNYLKETDSFLIQQKYDEYNKSFKLRNTFIITYAVLWLYSQIDLLLFTSDNESDQLKPIGSNVDINPYGNKFQLSFRIPL